MNIEHQWSMLMTIGLQEQEVHWAKETEEEPKKDDRTNSWAGLRNVTLFTVCKHRPLPTFYARM